MLHLNTANGKMSKSKGEFLTVSLLEEKGYDPLAYRLFCLQSHYRRLLEFSWENMDNAQQAYDKLVGRVAALDPADGPVDAAAQEPLRAQFRAALDNDLSTSLAVTAVYDVLKAKTNGATKLALLDEFDQVLALGLRAAAEARRAEQAAPAEADAAIDAAIAARQAARKAKNFAEADRIRDELKAQGIELIDTPQGVQWRRV